MTQSEQQRDLAWWVRLAKEFAAAKSEDIRFNSVILNFFWNLTEHELEVIQGAMSSPFSRQQICKMLTYIVKPVAKTAVELTPKLCANSSVFVDSVCRASTVSFSEDIQAETSIILKKERFLFLHPLESLFGITVDSLLSSCNLSDCLCELEVSELSGIVVEEVFNKVNSVIYKTVYKINTAKSLPFVYFYPESCAEIGDILINAVLRKLNALHCTISRSAATRAISRVLLTMEEKLPSAPRPSRTVDITSNVIEYILCDVVQAWQGKSSSLYGPIPVLHTCFERSKAAISLVLNRQDKHPSELDHPSGSDGLTTTTLLDTAMIQLYMKGKDFSSLDDSCIASEHLHQKLADFGNRCIEASQETLEDLTQTKDVSEGEEVRGAAKEFLHNFIEELVMRLLLCSKFSNHEMPVMPIESDEEDSCTIAAFHKTMALLTELLVSQVYDIQAKKFALTGSTNAAQETTFNEAVVPHGNQLNRPMTFRERLKNLKSTIVQKLMKPFRSSKSSKKESNSRVPAPHHAVLKQKRKKTFLGMKFSIIKRNTQARVGPAGT
ncbi:uncharacterized protein LOC127656172 [Xyrauchen texanus]|uniref:uncharacterized protein LOC127656172 n=1 Tax=Xyrauchen texanus TaxID=154827 RepID=UPI002241B665|nr:uncharacterized protein LOC127656172 [Xyrauchen texanus]